MDHETCAKWLIWQFWFWWPFLTWPWPWLQLNMGKNSLVSTFAWSLGVHMESFGRKTFEFLTVRNLNTPDFDLWPDLDLARDLDFTFSKVEASRRDLSNAASSVSLRPSVFEIARRVGSYPLPPHTGCGEYRNSPGGGGLTCQSFHFISVTSYWKSLFKSNALNSHHLLMNEIASSREEF